MKKSMLMVGLAMAAPNAIAAVSCSERVTAIIPHKDGHMFFNTSQTSGWAKLDWADDVRKDRGNAALLTAFTTGKTVEFYWPNLGSCSTRNPNYASPDYFIVKE